VWKSDSRSKFDVSPAFSKVARLVSATWILVNGDDDLASIVVVGVVGVVGVVVGVVGVVVVVVGVVVVAVGAVVVDLLVPRTRRNTASRKDRWKIIKLGRISSSVSWSCSFARKRRNMVVSRSCCAASLLSFDLGEAS